MNCLSCLLSGLFLIPNVRRRGVALQGQSSESTAPSGERNHSYATVHNGLTCSLFEALTNTPRISSIGTFNHQGMPLGHAHGGRLQPVLMRHTPQLSVKTRGGGGGGGEGGGQSWGGGGPAGGRGGGPAGGRGGG